MKAVIWADVVQMIIIMLGCVILVIAGAIKIGGMGIVSHRAEEGGRVIFNM